jgi:hypothetical protein
MTTQRIQLERVAPSRAPIRERAVLYGKRRCFEQGGAGRFHPVPPPLPGPPSAFQRAFVVTLCALPHRKRKPAIDRRGQTAAATLAIGLMASPDRFLARDRQTSAGTVPYH